MIIVNPILKIIGRSLTFILYFLTIVSAYGGYVNPHILSFPAIMTLILPYLAIATIVVTMVWIVCKKWITGAIGFATLAICWNPLTMAFPMKSSKQAAPGDVTFSLVSYNALHFQDLRSNDTIGMHNRTIKYLLDTDADIVCLVEVYNIDSGWETTNKEEGIKALKERYPYHISSVYTDMTVLSKYPLRPLEINDSKTKLPKCYTFWRINIQGHPLTLALVHLPSFSLSEDERKILTGLEPSASSVKSTVKEFKTKIRGKMTHAFAVRDVVANDLIKSLKERKGPLIVCGDFNDVPASWVYRMFLKNGFHDAFAETNFGPMHTYNDHLMFFHLDQVLYRGALKPLRLKRGNVNSSDHYPIYSEFAFTN